MRIFYSELCVLNRPLEEMLDTMAQYGGDCIELMMDGEYWDRLDERYEETVALLRARDAAYSVHPAAWDMNLTSENRDIRQATFGYYQRCIRFAKDICAGQVVIHPGFTCPVFDSSKARERARRAIEELAKTAAPLGIRLAVENVGNKSTCLYDQEQFEHALDGLGDEVGFLLDLGHAQITGFDIPGLIRRIGSRLFTVHIHDNDGSGDQHLPIGEGIIDFPAVFEALKTARQDCHLVLEYQYRTNMKKLLRDKGMLREIFAIG